MDHSPFSSKSSESSGKVNGYVLTSPALHLFLQNASFGLTDFNDDLPWSKYQTYRSSETTSLESTLVDPKQLKLVESSSPPISSTTCEEIKLLVTRRIYRRTTLLQLIELYAINNQGSGVNSKRRRGWLQVDATILEYFPDTRFPLSIRTFINQQTSSLSASPSSNSPSSLRLASKATMKLYHLQDRLIQRVYDHRTSI